jgi:hypothetical protein
VVATTCITQASDAGMQMGKELSAAQKAEEQQKLKRAAEVRRLEKEEMERARAKIQAKLDEDRCASPPVATVTRPSAYPDPVTGASLGVMS